MPKVVPVVQYESTVLHYGVSLIFWDYARLSFRTTGTDPDPGPGSTTSPSTGPLVGNPLFVLGLLPKWSLLCHEWRNDNTVPS